MRSAVSAASAAAPGRYDIVVSQLARAQVTASGVAAPDSNATIVATGGTITIGGVAVAIAAPVTLAGLASAINGTDGIGVTASVSETAPGSFRLILSARNTGAASAFTIANSLTGSTVSFTDTNGDNISGDSAADNAVQALNAALTINNVAVSSATNTLTSAIEGVTLTLHEADPALPATPWSYTLLDLTAQFPVKKLQVVEAEPGPVVFTPDGDRSVVLLRDDAAGVQRVDLVDLRSFIVDGLGLGSPPEGAGYVDATQKIFVSQEHPTGRITFLDRDGNVETVTGYRLNDAVKD